MPQPEDQVDRLLEEQHQGRPADEGEHPGQADRHPATVHRPVEHPAGGGERDQRDHRAEDHEPGRAEAEQALLEPAVLLFLPGGLHPAHTGSHRPADVPARQEQGEGERPPDVHVEHPGELLLEHPGDLGRQGAVDEALQEHQLRVQVEEGEHTEQPQQGRGDGEHQVEGHARAAGAQLVLPGAPAELLRQQDQLAEPHQPRSFGGSVRAGRSK